MENELKCPKCHKLYTYPVVLPCLHNLCFACAQSVQRGIPKSGDCDESSSCPSGGIGSSVNEVDNDIDKLSLISEADSGVVCNSRPNSYVGTPSIGNLTYPLNGNGNYRISCPVCNRITTLDELGVQSLPRNKVLENIVDKYGESKQYNIYCQMCEKDCKVATVMCEQCQIFYCDSCTTNCHPDRGPLSDHNLVPPEEGKAFVKAKLLGKGNKCVDHRDESLSLYCTLCRASVCCICVQDGRHINHEVQPLGAMCKSQKQELSGLLHRLSEKARSGTEFIQSLKTTADQLQEKCVSFEANTVSQCDTLIQALEKRKAQLLQDVGSERDRKHTVLREQVQHCTGRLQKTTGLLQFSIEVLKESDPAAFLQVSSNIIQRVKDTEDVFVREMEFEPRVTPEFELKLDTDSVMSTVNNLVFFQIKAPGPPRIIRPQCSAENNTVTLAWMPHPGGTVDGFVLEVDDGNSGKFRQVYCGKEMVCTVEGLHFDSLYRTRVKAFNHAGDSLYSETVCLQTATVAWFSLDPHTAHQDMALSNNNLTVTSSSYDDHIVLGSVGFSRGIHYWEWRINRYSSDTDPCFGVARFDVPKDQRIGKDSRGWAMYIDTKRSWFLHNGEHTGRTEGGIHQNSVVGVLLDLTQHTLSFFVDGEPHGPIAFTGLQGVFYPAVSLNHNVTATLQSGLVAPPVDSDTDED